MQQAHVLYFFLQRARFAAARKAPEAGAASAERPGGDGDLEGLYFRYDWQDVNAFSIEVFGEVLEMKGVLRLVFVVVFLYVLLNGHDE